MNMEEIERFVEAAQLLMVQAKGLLVEAKAGFEGMALSKEEQELRGYLDNMLNALG